MSPPWASWAVGVLEALYLRGAGERDDGNDFLGTLGIVLSLVTALGGAAIVALAPPLVLRAVLGGNGPGTGMLFLGWASVVALAVSAVLRDPDVCYEAGIHPGVPDEVSESLDWWVVRPPRDANGSAGPRPSGLEWLKPLETSGLRPDGGPILASRSGWGKPWVGRGVVAEELLAPFSISALSDSEEGGWTVPAQRGNVEQGPTVATTALLRDVLRPSQSDGRSSERPPPPLYLAEDAALLGRSERLRAAAKAVADAVLEAGLGGQKPTIRITMLWGGGGGALSGLHSDAEPANVLVQLDGAKDVWVFHPLDTEALGASTKYDMGARIAETDGFKLWRAPGGNASGRGAFPAGNLCEELNTVASLGEPAEPLRPCEPWATGKADGSTDEPVGPRLRGVLHVRLHPGDALLIPQGWMHMATTRTAGTSLSVRPVTLCEAFRRAPDIGLSVLHDMGLFRAGDCTCHDS